MRAPVRKIADIEILRAFAILFVVIYHADTNLFHPGEWLDGMLSDYFGQTYGDDGLRYAMLIVGMVASVGILMFFMAARTIRADLSAARALTHT